MKMPLIYCIILVYCFSFISSSHKINEYPMPLFISSSLSTISIANSKENGIIIGKITSNLTQSPLKSLPYNQVYSSNTVFAMLSNGSIVFVYGTQPTIALIDQDDTIDTIALNDYQSDSFFYSICTFENNNNNQGKKYIVIAWTYEDSYYIGMVRSDKKELVTVRNGKANGGKGITCVEGSIVFYFICCYVENNDLKVELYGIDEEKEMIDKGKNVIVNDDGNGNEEQYIVGKIIRIPREELISCYWSIKGNVYCYSVISTQNNQGGLSLVLMKKGQGDLLEECSYLNKRSFTLSKINDTRFIVACIKHTEFIYRTINNDFTSSSVILSQTANDSLSFLDAILLPEQFSLLFLYSLNQHTYLTQLSFPKCSSISKTIYYTDLAIGKMLLNHITSYNDNTPTISSFKIIFTNIPSFVSMTIDYNQSIQPNQLIPLSSIKTLQYHTTKKTNVALVNYNLINDLLIESPQCSLSLTICYETCNTCFHIGTTVNHQCTSCISNYYLLEGTQNCYEQGNSQNPYYLNTQTQQFSICYSSCQTCFDQGTTTEHNCIMCIDSYYKQNGKESNCYHFQDQIANYYFDELVEKFMACSPECKNCFDRPHEKDTNCIECANDYIPHPNDSSICIKACSPYTWYIVMVTQEYICTESTTDCPNPDYPILVKGTGECLNSCRNHFFQYNKQCLLQCPKDTYVDRINYKCYDKPIRLTLGDLNEMITALPKLEILQGENFTVQVYETTNKSMEHIKLQAINNKMTYIDFEECFYVLKRVWNILDDQDLLVAKLEIGRANQTTNQIEYKVYENRGNELSLSACDNLNIKVNYGIVSTENDKLSLQVAHKMKEIGVDIYNPNDIFFNDYCFNYTSETNRDVIIYDRRTDYFKNVSFCEENCTYLEVDLDTQRVECACPIKIHTDLAPKPNYFQQDYENEFVSSNYEVVICYKLVFDAKIFKMNKGNYLILAMFLIHVGISIHYCITGAKPVAMKINSLKKAKDKEAIESLPAAPPNLQHKKTMNSLIISRQPSRRNAPIIISEYTQETSQGNNTNIYGIGNNSIHQASQNIIYHNNWINEEDKRKKNTRDFFMPKKTKDSRIMSTIMQPIKLIMNDFDDMKYKEAIEKDKRSFLTIYFHLIKCKQICLCLFFNQQLIFKGLHLSVFILGTATDFFFNALFFTDQYIHIGYETNEDLSFWITMPKSILSFVLTAVFLYFLEFLTSSKLKISTMQKGRDTEEFNRECNTLIKVIKLKIVIYLVTSYVTYWLFWYYVTAFCAVYQNSQISWIRSSFVSFGISIFLPFFTCFACTFFRFLGVRTKKK